MREGLKFEGNGGIIFTRAKRPNRRIGSEGQQIIDKPTYNKLTKAFIKHGGIIQDDDEAVEHLRRSGAHAAYLPSLNVILVSTEATVSDILEETYHAEQDRTHMYGEFVTDEVLLRREIDAQNYLISMKDRYKIPDEEIQETRANLAKYEQRLIKLLENQGGEHNE